MAAPDLPHPPTVGIRAELYRQQRKVDALHGPYYAAIRRRDMLIADAMDEGMRADEVSKLIGMDAGAVYRAARRVHKREARID